MKLSEMIERLQTIQRTQADFENVWAVFVDDGVVLVEHSDEDDE